MRVECLVVMSGNVWMRQNKNASIWPVVGAHPSQVEESCGGKGWRRVCFGVKSLGMLQVFNMGFREELRCIPRGLSECHTVVGGWLFSGRRAQ